MSHETRHETIEHLDFTIPCESSRCSTDWNRPEHDADWLVLFACNCEGYLCDARLQFILVSLSMGKSMHCPKCFEPGALTAHYRLRP